MAVLLWKFVCTVVVVNCCQQKEELWADLMSFVSTLNTSDVTDNINLMTPEIHTLLNRLALSDVDSINFTSYDILVCRSSVLQFLFFLCVFSFSWFYFLELLPVESGPQK